MFDVGEYVVFGIDGVCQVESIGSLDIDGISKDKLYYTLIPVGKNGNGKIYTPVDGTRITIRRVIDREGADKLINEIKDIDKLTVPDEKKREERYKQVIQNCDLREIIQLIKEILARKEMRDSIGKKLTALDERYFGIAENCLFSELSLPLEMEKSEIRDYITSRCDCVCIK
ncbi:MAG: CarD family transcriptional regulator [Lachnospiraceae bacterium]|nr:CarD family transcriptional regulator [Lachnospiraceae bacterium]